MEKTFNPCDECEYSYSKQNQGNGMCKICEFKKMLDLEEQGKLMKLPCAVGDTVYVKMQSGGYAEAEVRDYIYFISCGFCVVVTSTKGEFSKQNIPFSEFGRTIFKTQEEAEVVLRK